MSFYEKHQNNRSPLKNFGHKTLLSHNKRIYIGYNIDFSMSKSSEIANGNVFRISIMSLISNLRTHYMQKKKHRSF